MPQDATLAPKKKRKTVGIILLLVSFLFLAYVFSATRSHTASYKGLKSEKSGFLR